jgi:hypothetical protein
VKLEVHAPQAIALLLILAAFAVGIWAYGTRYPVLPAKRRSILLVVRLLALLAILSAALAPVVRYPETSRSRNRLLILIDHSGSMDLRDASGARSRRAAADSAAAAIAGELGRRYDVRCAAFDAALGPFAKDAGSAAEKYPGGGETGLGDAIHSALARVDPDSVAALLVLSDGVVNRGEDPERALAASLPGFALTVGRAADPPTVGIAGVETPPELIVSRPTPLVVGVRQGARARTSGLVRVSEEGVELGRAPFSLSGPGASAQVSIPVRERFRGKRFLTVELLNIPDDPVRENKRRLVAIDARPAKRSVPVLASTWDWDLRSLARGVEEDTTQEVVRLSPAGSSQVARLGGAPAAFESYLDDAEAVVVRLTAPTITPERAQALLRYLNRGGGVLFWIDPTPSPPAESPLTRALSFQWRFWGQPVGPTATADLTPAGRLHEVSLLGGDASTSSSTWSDLPPVEPIIHLGTSRSPLQALVNGRIGSESVPLVLAGSIGRGRAVVLNAAGVYRWGLTASGITGRAGIEASFFGGLVRWLAAGREERPVHIAAPEITPEGRPVAVQVTASVAGGAQGAEAKVVARSSARGRVESKLALSGPGEFTGAMGLPPGIYTLEGRVIRGGGLVGTDSVRVAVGVQGIEYETLAADPAALRRLAESSGGTAAPLDSAETVLAKLRSPELLRARLAEVDLFHNPFLFTILILALTLEWALRRRFHLM